MKRIAVYIPMIALTLLFCTVGAFAMSVDPGPMTSIVISDRSVASEEDELQITGSQPVISGLGNTKFQAEINSLIKQEYAEKKEAAKKDAAKKINFAYEDRSDGEYYSIIIRTSTVAVSTKEEIRTFVLGTADKLLTVNDVLGLNGVKIINKVISDEMSKRPGTYNPDFGGITEAQSFYVENGSVVVIFDKYAIGSAALGTPEFVVNIEGVRNNTFTIGRSHSYIKDPYNVKMIPLRVVCTGLGFGVSWDHRTFSVDITRDNVQVASLTPGKNIYFKSKYPAYTLEFAPEIDKDGVTYLPISFFERILDAHYTVDQAGSITFSYYAAP